MLSLDEELQTLSELSVLLASSSIMFMLAVRAVFWKKGERDELEKPVLAIKSSLL